MSDEVDRGSEMKEKTEFSYELVCHLDDDVERKLEERVVCEFVLLACSF